MDILRHVPLVAFALWIGWLYVRARRKRPQVNKSDMVYREYFASGSSHKNILTKWGGARQCLQLLVTKNLLIVTSWFPFSIISPLYDLEHVIPLDSITSVHGSTLFGFRILLLTYRGEDGEKHTLSLRPRRPEDFIRSLGMKNDDKNSS